jgi:hypothetical protein
VNGTLATVTRAPCRGNQRPLSSARSSPRPVRTPRGPSQAGPQRISRRDIPVTNGFSWSHADDGGTCRSTMAILMNVGVVEGMHNVQQAARCPPAENPTTATFGDPTPQREIGRRSFTGNYRVVAAHQESARAEHSAATRRVVLRYLEAFGPATPQDLGRLGQGHPAIHRALQELDGELEQFEGPSGQPSTTCPERRDPTRTFQPHLGCCPCGTTPCSPTPTGAGSFPLSTES